MNGAALAVELALPLGAAALLWLVASRPDREVPRWVRGALVLAALFLLTRVGTSLWVHLGEIRVRTDAWGWWKFWNRIEDGQVPGREFRNFYGPFFPYLMAAFGRAFGTWGVQLPLLLADGAVVLLAAAWARRLGGASAGWWTAAWFTLCPFHAQVIAVRSQDESLFQAFLLGGTLLVLLRRDGGAAVTLALGMLFSKPTLAPYAAVPLLAMALRRRAVPAAPWAVFLLITGGAWLALHLAGAVVAPGVTRNFGAGFSVADVVRRVLPGTPSGAAVMVFAAVSFAAAVAFTWRAKRLPGDASLLVPLAALHAVTMLTMPACVSPYAFQGAAFPVLLSVLRAREDAAWRWMPAALAGFGLLGALSWGRLPGIVTAQQALGIPLFGWMLWLCVRELRGTSTDDVGRGLPVAGTTP